MANSIRAAGETAPLRFDAAEFRLVAESEPPHLLNLGNAYQDYCSVPRESRVDVVKRYTRGWFTVNKQIPTEFEDARHDLLPIVRSRFMIESMRLRIRVEGTGVLDWPYRPLAEHLAVSLAYDLPQAMGQVMQHHLTGWGIAFDAALEVAMENLRERTQAAFEKPVPCVWASTTGDGYDSSRLVLTEILSGYDVEGDLIAVVPNRDTLLLTGSEDLAGLTLLATVAKDSGGEARPICPAPFRLLGETWTPFLPEPEHPLHQSIKELWLKFLAPQYEEQGKLLNALHEKTGDEIFVASFTAVQNTKTNELRSYAVWSEGVDTLLPEADLIHFVRPGEPKASIVATGSWDRVVEVVGGLMVPQGIYPERYRVRKFPSEGQLAKIRAE